MSKITLITNSKPLEKVFTNTLNRHNIPNITIDNINELQKSDMVFLDELFTDNDLDIFLAFSITIEKFTSKIAVITNNTEFNKELVSFILPRPFLPLKLIDTVILGLSQINLENTSDDQNNNKTINTVETAQENTTDKNIDINIENKNIKETNNIQKSLVLDDNISKNEYETNSYSKPITNNNAEEFNTAKNNKDQGMIDIESLEPSSKGTLNKNDLHSIKNILKEHDYNHSQTIKTPQEAKTMPEIDMEDITIKKSSHTEQKTNTLILGNLKKKQLRPIVKVMTQDTIDELSKGKTVDLKMKLIDD